MIEQAFIEFLKGIGRFFLNPLTYYLVFFAIMMGWLRVKRERRDFHIRVFDIFEEFSQLFPKGLLIGFILSLVTLALGVVLPVGAIAIMAAIAILCSFTFKIRWLSPAYVVGLAFFVFILFKKVSLNMKILNDVKNTSLPSVAILLGLLVIAEGFLIFYSKHRETTPVLMKSKRGLIVGAHSAKRLWLLPVFLLLPGSVIQAPFDWWPLLSIHGETYSLIVVPFAAGLSMKTHGMLPEESIRKIGANVIWLGVIVAALAAASIWAPMVAILAASIAIFGREAISFRHRLQDDALPFYYSKRDQGLVILGIIPSSPAAKMALKIGEIIVKVNGQAVNSTDEFYQLLQKNSAYCKLEVLDTNGEVRFVQRALYDGEHYELGILFVNDDKKWEPAVG